MDFTNRNLLLIPPWKQVNVIWLSKVTTDVVQLEYESGVSEVYISHILSHRKEILNRWLNESGCIKNKEIYKIRQKKYECHVLDQILFEWTRRKMLNLKRTVHPREIELQANVIKQQLNVPKYSIEIHFRNSVFYKLSLSGGLDQSLSLDTADILNDICQEIYLPTYAKFKTMLNRLDLIQSIGARMSGLNETLDQLQLTPEVIDIEATEECIECILCESERTSGNEVRHKDETKAVNAGQPETKKEERCDQLCQEFINVIPKTEEPEKDFEESFYTRNKNKDLIPLKEIEEHKRSYVKDDTKPIAESTEDEVIRQEVLDILAELQEEIQSEELRSSQLREDSSVGSIKDIPSMSTTLIADNGNLPTESAHSKYSEKSLMLLTTDSIQELVEKYEIYKSQQQSLQVSKILSGYQETPANDFMKIDGMSNKVLNRDASGTMDKRNCFSTRRENIEYSNIDFTEIDLEQKLKEDKTMDGNISEHKTNVQATFTKLEKTKLTDQENQCDDVMTKREQRILENDTPFECVISEDNTNLGINEKESKLFAENIYHIEKYNSDIAYKKAHGDSSYISPSKKNETMERIEILVDRMPLKDTTPKQVKKLKHNNFQIVIELENINDSEGGYIQLIETTSDEEDVDDAIHNVAIDEMRNKVLNRDASGTMDKRNFFSSSRENIEYSNSDFTEIDIEQKLREDKTMDGNICEHQTNVQATFIKLEKTKFTDQQNQWDDVMIKREQRILENDTPVECVISEGNTNLGINEKESKLFAENIYHTGKYNSGITYKKAHGDSSYISPSKKNQTTERTEILKDPIPLKDTAPEQAEELKHNNFEIVIELENNINDSEGDFIQLIQTTSDEEDVDDAIHNVTIFNWNNNENDMKQSYTTTEDLRDRRSKSMEAEAPKINSEIIKAVPHKRKKLVTPQNYNPKRICMERGPKNKSSSSTGHYFHNDNRVHYNNMTHFQEDSHIIPNLEDCNYGENGRNEYITLLEIVSDGEDDLLGVC